MGNSCSTVEITNLNESSTEYRIVCPGENVTGDIPPCCTMRITTQSSAELRIARHAVVNTSNGQHWYIICNRIIEKGAHGFPHEFETQMKAVGLWEEVDQGFQVMRAHTKPQVINISCSPVQSVKAPARCKPIELYAGASASASHGSRDQHRFTPRPDTPGKALLEDNMDLTKNIDIAHDLNSGETLTLRGVNIAVAETIKGVLVAHALEDITLSQLQGATVNLTSKTGDITIQHAKDSKLTITGGLQSLIEIGDAEGCEMHIEGHINVTGRLNRCKLMYKGTFQTRLPSIACSLKQI